jgi:hypothetical protein
MARAKEIIAMQNLSLQIPLRRTQAACKPVFRLFIACEDQNALLQARKVETQVEELCGDMAIISRVIGSFAFLRYPQFQPHAVAEAAEADMIIVSIDGANEIPSHVKCLLDNLPFHWRTRQAALVTLIGANEDASRDSLPEVDYLRRLAISRHMDFFCNRDGKINSMRPKKVVSQYFPCNAGNLRTN